MTVPFFSSVREYKNKKQTFDTAIQSVLEKGDFILGNAVQKLEESIALYASSPYTVGCGNGSDALLLACIAAGLNHDDEVLTPVFTFFASSSCIYRTGAKPVFVDIEEETCLMDMNAAANKTNKHTKGILPVHLFTQMVDMNVCMQLANEHNLFVIEDAAEAFGMKQNINGTTKTAGTVGTAGVYSFFPTKTLGGYGDGGMVLTNNENWYNKIKALRVHGATKKYHHDYVGFNSRLDTLQAAILNVKLEGIDTAIAKRAHIAAQYSDMLSDIEEITLPVIKTGNVPVFYVYNIRAKNRDKLNGYLHQNEIGTSIYYPVPLHLQKCFAHLGYKKGDFPVAERLCDEVLAIPIFPELTENEVSYVAEKIREFYKK